MQHESTERIESKAVPGVVITMVCMVEGHRIELRRLSAAVSQKIRPFARQVGELDGKMRKLLPKPDLEGKMPDVAVEPSPELTQIQNQMRDLMETLDFIEQTELEPIWIQWAVKKIEGDLTIDGQPPTASNIAFGPTALYREILAAIRERLGLSEPQVKNSSSLTTSIDPVGGTATDTTAISAGDPTTASTGLVIVPAISATA